MSRPRYISVCSGIEAVTVAAHDLMDAAAFCEYEAFPSAVLAHHYPTVPNVGDLTKWRDWPHDLLADADILVGGTPCQAFSVAGLRNSLADDRGNLSLEFVRLADAIDDLRLSAGKPPAVIVWENVPGVLSVKDNAFGCFLAALAGEDAPLVPTGGRWTDAGVVIGPERAVCWRILDAQYFGLAQRRRRVFVVASAREGFDPAAVLLEWEGLRRDTPPRREAGQGATHDLAPSLTSSGRGVERAGETRGQDPVVAVTTEISHCLNAGGMGRQDYETETLVAHTLKAEGFDASEDGTGRGTPLVPVIREAVAYPINTQIALRHNALGERTGMGIGDELDPAFTLQAGHSHAVAVSLRGREGGGTAELGDEVQNCLRASSGGGDKPHVLAQMAVRRLTPVECERLQGFPDGYTAIPWRGKPAEDCPDGPRYKALGNSMAVPVMRWIFQRVTAQLVAENSA